MMHIPFPGFRFAEGVEGRLIFIVILVLGEYAQPQLVEGRLLQGLHGPLDQGLLLVDHGIHRGTEGVEQLPIPVDKGGTLGFYGAMAAFPGFPDFQRSLRFHAAPDRIGALSRHQGQIADLIYTAAAVKALDRADLFPLAEGGCQVDLNMGPLRLRPEKVSSSISY